MPVRADWGRVSIIGAFRGSAVPGADVLSSGRTRRQEGGHAQLRDRPSGWECRYMALRLSIMSGDVADSGNRGRWTFGVNGGRIGRAHDNDWVIVDPERFISAHHAEIEHRAGEWWICDTSTNGTFINDATRPLGRGGRHRLSNGDRIRCGSLELLAEISGGNDFLPDEEDFALSETALDDSFEGTTSKITYTRIKHLFAFYGFFNDNTSVRRDDRIKGQRVKPDTA